MPERFDDPHIPDMTLPPSGGDTPRALPDPAALVGADAPCEPIPPPPESRHWDAAEGRWVHDGVSVPPDPAGVSFAPTEASEPTSEPTVIAGDDTSDDISNDIDAPVPRWVLVVVAAMFVVGMTMGLLFAALK